MHQAISRPRHYLDWSGKGRCSIWLYFLAVILGYLGLQWGSIPVLLLAGDHINDRLFGPALLELSFAGFIVTVLLTVRLILGRPAWSVGVPAWPPRWIDYLAGMLMWWAGMLLMYLIFVIPFGRVSFQGWGVFSGALIPYLAAITVGVMVQTAAEELFFRGLLMQATRRATAWLPAVIGVQALWFAHLHAGNVSAWGGGYMAMLPYFATALALGWAAWRSGSLLLPMGMHFANNIALFVLVKTEGDVVEASTPFIAQAASPASASVQAIGQALMMIALIEYLHKRGNYARQLGPG
jgi:membrane protease YdiL (CAAX protease family)